MKMILVIAVILIAFFLLGNLIRNHTRLKMKDENPMVIGFMFLIGIFQILVIPFMLFHTKFTYLYVFVCVLFIVVLGIAIYDWMRESKEKIHFNFDWTLVIAFILIAVQAIGYIFLLHSDADDSFYIAEISTILDSNQILAFDPTTGDTNFLFQSQYELVGYEVFLSVLCKIFRVNPALFCHTLLPIVVLLIHYCVVYELCKKITKKSKNIAFLMVTIINMFSGYAVYSRGAFLLFRLWQGKAVLVNIVLPILLLLFWNLFEKKKADKEDILLLTLCTYCGFCMSAIGLYLVPLTYAVYTLTFFIYTGKWKEVIKLCVPMILALPYVIIKYIVMSAGKTVDLITEAADSLDYASILKNINGSGYMLAVWIIAVILVVFAYEKENRYLLGIYPLICFLTFLNPVLCNLIAKYITGTSVYWRLFWSLQFSFTFIAALIAFIDKWKRKNYFTIISLIVIISCGKWIYSSENFTIADNSEKISLTTKNVVDVLLNEEQETCRLLLPTEYAVEVRQYTGKIELVWSRYSRTEYRLNDDLEMFQILEMVYNCLYTEKNYDSSIVDTLEIFDVDYLALYSNEDNADIEEKYQCIYTDENISVYDIRRNK